MEFKQKNLRKLAEAVVGDVQYFPYRSSSRITEFFADCDLNFIHDGSTRWRWTADKLAELLLEPSTPGNIPERFLKVFQVLMEATDADEEDCKRENALRLLNEPLNNEGFEAFYGADNMLYFKNMRTQSILVKPNPHRPLTVEEIQKKEQLSQYLDNCSEDDLIEHILLPLFRQLGFQKISAAGHKDKALEYGKDIWMKFVLPTQHVLYFGLQVKKGKLDAAGVSKASNSNIAEIHNQVLMMLGHEIFDSEISRNVLVDHAFIVAGGEITKQAKNWLGGKLDNTKRSQILFIDREDILNLYISSHLPFNIFI